MVQAEEDIRRFSAPKGDYHPHSRFLFLLSGLGPAWQRHVQAGTRAEGNFPQLRPRQCGGQCPRLPAARGESAPGEPGKVLGRRRKAPPRAGRAPQRRRREPDGRGECPGGQRKHPSGLGERPGVCPGLLPERGALRPRRTPPTRVASAEQGYARLRSPPGRPANPCRAGRAPRTPPAGALRADGDTRSPQGVCGWPCSAPPRLFPPPRRLATHRDRAGRWALFHRGRGEARLGAGAERGAGRGGRPCAEEGGRRRPATRSRSLEPARRRWRRREQAAGNPNTSAGNRNPD